ncbi:MAG TPA: response regulator [Myxococcales bacterium]|nr:response regulator [Myxococcales bacterium]
MVPTNHAGTSVVVVDDDLSVRRALQRLIRSAGFSVEAFASGQKFLDSDPGGASRCVVLDIHLGGMSGLEVQERLAARGVRMPVIVITAHDDARMRARVESLGAVYLRKPFDDGVLLDAIRKAVTS